MQCLACSRYIASRFKFHYITKSRVLLVFMFLITAGKDLPIRTTGQDFLHSCLHFLGLHLSELTMAIRVSLSCDIFLSGTKNEDRNSLLSLSHIGLTSHIIKL